MALDPLTLSIVGQAAIGAVQTGVGIAKQRAATRPEYQLPRAMEEAMTEAQQLSYYGLPDAQKQEFLDNVARSTAGQVRGLSDRRAGAGAVQVAAQGERDAYKGLLSRDAQARLNNIQRLQQTRQVYAQYEDRMFNINELQPYMQEVQGAAALGGAGLQNMMGALQTAAMGSIYGAFGDGNTGSTDGGTAQPQPKVAQQVPNTTPPSTPTFYNQQMYTPQTPSTNKGVVTRSQLENQAIATQQQVQSILSAFGFNTGQ